MNRRTFLQSLGAAFSTVALGVRPVIGQPLKIRYDLFCDRWGTKYDLSQPVSQNGQVIATDCRTLIAHPGEWSGETVGKVPDFSKLWWGEFDTGGWGPLKASRSKPVGRYEWMGCPDCLGIGRIGRDVRACLDCTPESEWVDKHGQLRDGCGKCFDGWLGGRKCDRCGGDGNTSKDVYRDVIGGEYFDPARIARVRTLGEVEAKVVVVPQKTYGEMGVLLFRGGDGLKGMLCAMTK